MKKQTITSHKDQTVALCIDTIRKNKQALVFCSSKKGAESQAEKTSKASTTQNSILYNLSQNILHTLATPTKQCKRLALCIEKGVAFHHAGLHSKQRELIEEEFRKGSIKVICSTPTLAAGLDLPAFRAIIRDHKRFGQRGMTPIPVLEYHQMIGRAGRPGQEDFGEGIIIAGKPEDIKHLTQQYINGEIENIYSKLAVEPVLRTYILSLVSTEIVRDTKELFDFFKKTFYAHQFKDYNKLEITLRRIIRLLKEWNMIQKTSEEEQEEKDKNEKEEFFQSATEFFSKNKINKNSLLEVSELGRRVSEMYVDPLTATIFLKGIASLKQLEEKDNDFMIAHMICCSLELRPLLRVKTSNQDIINKICDEKTLISEEEFYEYSGDNFEDTLLTTNFFIDWMNEESEDKLMETYDIRPGEILFKQQHADWLLYVCEELCRITKQQSLIKYFKNARIRIKNGVKKELISLLRFKGVGRVRARTLFNKNIKTTKDVLEIPFGDLVEIVGVQLAKKMKEEVGEQVSQKDIESIVERSRRIHNQQTQLGDY